MEFLRLGGKSELRAVMQALRGLERSKKPFKVEIEKTHIHFATSIAVKKKVAVFAKPSGVGKHLDSESLIRLKLPEGETRSLRLPVVKANFNTSGGQSVFICKIPTEFADGPQRQHVRFDTRHFNNLNLHIPEWEDNFKIVDLSRSGMGILVLYENAQGQFPVGQAILPAALRVGERSLELAMLRPRRGQAHSIGLEYDATKDEQSEVYLSKLFQSLEERLAKKLGVP